MPRNLSPINLTDAAAALAAALRARAAGAVPLLIDPRALLQPNLLRAAVPETTIEQLHNTPAGTYGITAAAIAGGMGAAVLVRNL